MQITKKYVSMAQTVTILTLLLIATPSVNSAHSSLLQESVIPNRGTIPAMFEIELLETDDTPSLYNESGIDVLATVQQTSRYGVSGEAWVDGVWMNSSFFDTTLSDRFIVKSIEEKAIIMSSYAWVEWTAPVLEGTPDDGELPPPDGEFDIFFEYGAESGVLQPPWDIAGPWGGGSKTGSKIEVVDSPARTGTKSVEMYQKPPPKDDAQRRLRLMKIQEGWEKKEFYISWWVYFPDESPWNTIDPDGWGANLGGWGLRFGPPEDRYQMWTMANFRVDKTSRELKFQYTFAHFPDQNNRTIWNWDSGFYVDEHLNEWIQLKFYAKITTGSDSVITGWINDNMVGNKTTWDSPYFSADPSAYSEWNEYNCEYAGNSEGGYPNLRINFYDDTDSKEKRIFVDDVIWATEQVPQGYGVVDR